MKCRKCNIELVIGENWAKSQAKRGSRICRACEAEYAKQHKAQSKARGKCPGHPSQDAVAGYTVCLKCLERQTLRNTENKARGKCTSHPSQDPVAGYTVCLKCLERQTLRSTEGAWTYTQKKEAFELQHHKCAICSKELTMTTAHADHHHGKKTPRELLCNKCNTGIGGLEKMKQVVKYYEYLMKHDSEEIKPVIISLTNLVKSHSIQKHPIPTNQLSIVYSVTH